MPDKFLLAGHSLGGYLASLYASQHQERILKLFCVSPAGFEPYVPEAYDAYKYPDFDKPEQVTHHTIVEAILKTEDEQKHPQAVFRKMKPEKLRKALEKKIKTQFYRPENPSTPEQVAAYLDYQCLMFQRLSSLENVVLKPFKFPFLARHPMQAVDRLGNPEIDFPIAAAFGSKDYFGSEGADEIIRNNKYFKDG